MKACSVKFSFSVGDQVTINATQLTGTVVGVYVGRDGEKSALVEYHDRAGVLQQHYFRRDALR